MCCCSCPPRRACLLASLGRVRALPARSCARPLRYRGRAPSTSPAPSGPRSTMTGCAGGQPPGALGRALPPAPRRLAPAASCTMLLLLQCHLLKLMLVGRQRACQGVYPGLACSELTQAGSTIHSSPTVKFGTSTRDKDAKVWRCNAGPRHYQRQPQRMPAFVGIWQGWLSITSTGQQLLTAKGKGTAGG